MNQKIKNEVQVIGGYKKPKCFGHYNQVCLEGYESICAVCPFREECAKKEKIV